jgi:hypothetical protein
MIDSIAGLVIALPTARSAAESLTVLFGSDFGPSGAIPPCPENLNNMPTKNIEVVQDFRGLSIGRDRR